MATPPSTPLDQMTGEEVRAWKDWLLEEGKRPRPFKWATQAVPISESEYDYEPLLDKVIEHSTDGKRYIVGIRNAELQRLQNLPDSAESMSIDVDTRPLTDLEVRAILNALSDAQRHCLKLYYVEGYSCKEIAERTALTEKQVKSHLQNGLHRFSAARKAISEEDVKSSLLRSLHPLNSR